MNYKLGLKRMKVCIEREAPEMLSDFLTLEDRFLRNEHAEKTFGVNSTTRTEHSQVIHSLNELAKKYCHTTFNEYCQDNTKIDADTPESGSRAVFITALPVEYRAVRAHLSNLVESKHPKGTVYETGVFANLRRSWNVSLVEIGPGNNRSAMETERAIQFFQPNIVLFVGVAGGIKDVALGDVVVATKIYGYESGKEDVSFLPRPDVGNTAYVLEQRARLEARKSKWFERINNASVDLMPRVFVAPIVAGEKVLSSTSSLLWKFLRSNYSDALAIEMEGRGFLVSVHANHDVAAIVIRGVSDLIDQKQVSDSKGWQDIASRHASAFAFEMLANL